VCIFKHSDKIKILIIPQLKHEIYTSTHKHKTQHNKNTRTQNTQKGTIKTMLYGKKRPEFNFHKFISATRTEMRLQKSYYGL
jgi:hypothetical protein